MSKSDRWNLAAGMVLLGLLIGFSWFLVIAPARDGIEKSDRCRAAGYTGTAWIIQDQFCFHLNGVAGDFIRVDQLGK